MPWELVVNQRFLIPQPLRQVELLSIPDSLGSVFIPNKSLIVELSTTDSDRWVSAGSLYLESQVDLIGDVSFNTQRVRFDRQFYKLEFVTAEMPQLWFLAVNWLRTIDVKIWIPII